MITPTVTFTLPELARKVIELANEKPHFIYKATGGVCLYTAGQRCSGCIWGQALMELGVPRDWLVMMDTPGDYNGYQDIVYVLNQLGFANVPAEFAQVQRDQDVGRMCVKPLHDWLVTLG